MIANTKKIATASLFAILVACSSPEEKLAKYSAEGQEFLEKEDFGRANVQFQNALKINDEHVPALVGLAEIAENRQDFAALYGFLERIIRLDPTQVDARVKLGQLYLISSDEESALEQAEEALSIDPSSNDAVALKSAVQLKLGDYEGAVDLARRVVERDPAHSEAITVLATERTIDNDIDGALAILDRALSADPSKEILQLLRIQLLDYQGDDEAVAEAYEGLIASNPDQKAYRQAFAKTLLSNEYYDEAILQLEKVVEIDPESFAAKLDVIRVLNSAKGIEAAEARLRDYKQQFPGDSELGFALVDFLREQEKYDAAEAELQQYLQSDDQDVMLKAKNRLVNLRYSNGDKSGAETLVDEILAADDGNTEALLKRAGFRVEDENYEEGILDLRTVLNNEPDNSRAMMLMATAFEGQGNINFAQAELGKAFEVSKSDPDVARFYAAFLIRHDKVARAEEVLEQSLARNPGDIDTLKRLAAVRLSLEDWQGADEIATVLSELDSSDGASSSIRALASTGLQDFDRVIDTLTEREEVAPLASRPLTTLISAYIRTERFDDAEELLNRIIAADPANYDARILLTQVFGAQDKIGEAEQTLLVAKESNPARTEAWELLYRYYVRTNQDDKATALINGGLEDAPDNAALRVFQADAMLSRGENEKAFEIYKGLRRDRPNDRIIANNFASLSNLLRDDPQSNAEALEAAQLLVGSESPFLQDTLGWANLRAGNTAEALDLLATAALRAPENAEILYHLGAAQIAAGENDQARSTLEAALEKAPDEAPFKADIQELLEGL